MDKRLLLAKSKLHKLLGYASLILIVMLTASTIKNINRVITIRKEVEKERAKVEKMEADNAKLQAQILEAQGQEFIDAQIRNKLGLTKEGETVVVLPEASLVRSLAPSFGRNEEVLPDPNWLQWKKLFF